MCYGGESHYHEVGCPAPAVAKQIEGYDPQRMSASTRASLPVLGDRVAYISGRGHRQLAFVTQVPEPVAPPVKVKPVAPTLDQAPGTEVKFITMDRPNWRGVVRGSRDGMLVVRITSTPSGKNVGVDVAVRKLNKLEVVPGEFASAAQEYDESRRHQDPVGSELTLFVTPPSGKTYTKQAVPWLGAFAGEVPETGYWEHL